MRLLLYPLSLFLNIIITIRNWLFDYKILTSISHSTPIICIGNLSIGGSGKTPHTNYIINLLKDHYNVAVLSRGYGRITNNLKYVKNTDKAKYVGDEALLYKQKHPEITVVVEKDRNKGIRNIMRDYPDTDVILLDDGLQHRWTNPGLKIVITTYQRPYFNDYLFPLGSLRENKSGAKRHDIIIVSKCPEEMDKKTRKKMKSSLDLCKHQSAFFSSIKYSKLECMKSSELLLEFKEFSITLVTGIADSSLIIDYLNNNQQRMVHLRFSDHHKYTIYDIHKILSTYDKDKSIKKLILTTEKDATKLMEFKNKFESRNVYVLPINVVFNEQKEFDTKILNYVENNKRNN
tara:strand:+ start:772 stop:1812 length:1041 start_codon:yes stop_codon:yes gene_type:complete